MNVLFVASECVPFVKTGGLADVIGALPKELNSLEIDARVILPKYKAIPNTLKLKMRKKKELVVSLGWRNQNCSVEELEHDGVTYYFIDNEYYFYRDELYGYENTLDEAERFAFFSKAVLEVIPYLEFKPDILHLNDWQTGLVSLFLKDKYSHLEEYKDIRTIFTIHNLKYQGIFPKQVLGDILDIDSNYFHSDGIEYYDNINYLKAGIVFSDKITTVSETYAKEIQYPFFGEGMAGLLYKRKNDITGIINGIDITEYNPSTDLYLFKKYKNVNGKTENKIKLQKMLGLPINKEVPMLSVISRLVSQKGLDLVIHVIEELLKQDIQIVILGTGEHKYESFFKQISLKYPEKLSVNIIFNEELSRKIYAASDLFLMPSLFEPCGLSQLIAMRYKVVPIVRETGGLIDTVTSFNEFTGDGNGFSFANYNAHDMLNTIKRALFFYNDKKRWKQIIENIEKKDYSWEQSANKYIDLYDMLLTKEMTKCL